MHTFYLWKAKVFLLLLTFVGLEAAVEVNRGQLPELENFFYGRGNHKNKLIEMMIYFPD